MWLGVRHVAFFSFEAAQQNDVMTTTCQNGESVSVFVIVVSFGMGFEIFHVQIKLPRSDR